MEETDSAKNEKTCPSCGSKLENILPGQKAFICPKCANPFVLSKDGGKHIVIRSSDEINLQEQLFNISKMLGDRSARSNVVMTRLDDEDLNRIDALVEIEAFKSRSEATAFFVKEGMNARADVFEKILSTVEKIRELKGEAIRSISREEKPDANNTDSSTDSQGIKGK